MKCKGLNMETDSKKNASKIDKKYLLASLGVAK